MKRFLSAGIPVKILSILSLLALLALLLPMLNAAKYDVPSADDYGYGIDTYFAWKETGSFLKVLEAAFHQIGATYRGWQGSFSAIFMFLMNPMIYGEQYYQICPWLIIGMLLAGIFSLTITVWKGIYGASLHEAVFIAVIWAVLCTQFLPRASQGFYWYNGAVYYTFFFGLAACTYALLLRFLLRKEGEKGIGRLLTGSVLLFFIGGGNLVTGLTTAVLIVTMEVLLIFLKNEDWKKMLIPAVCFFAGFLINVAAPGNAVRQQFFYRPGVFPSVVIAFRQVWLFSGKWYTLPVIALLLLSLPMLLRIAARTRRTFKAPWLVSLYSVCLSGVMFYPPVYSMTEHNLEQLGRIINIIFFGMMLLTIYNLFYWTGWLLQKGVLRETMFPAAHRNRLSLTFLLLILVLFSFGMTRIKWFDTTSISAFRSYRSGQMGNYWHIYRQRLEILKDPEIRDAVLKRFPSRPYVLFYQELSENPDGNRVIASWYGKDSVIIH